MQIYLPIAELSVNVFMILAMGGAVGFLSGMFGVGGGFLMTPLLIFSGIPPAVAVASEANQVVAASMSGALFHWRKRAVDIKMGLVLLSGGVVGSFIGVWIFGLLKKLGQVDLLISLSYVVFLGAIGGLMLIESLRAIRRAQKGERVGFKKPGQHNWIHGLPLKMRFKSSKLYISAIPPVLIGVAVGILAAIMGVGGGFIMVPAMIYLLAGGVIGAQFGAKAGQRLKAEQLRALLAIMVLGVALRLALDLLIEPTELFSITSVVAGQ